MRLVRMALVAVLITVAWVALRWEQVEAPVLLALSGGGTPVTFLVSSGGCEPSSLGEGYRCQAQGTIVEGEAGNTRSATLGYLAATPETLASGEERQALLTVLVNDEPRLVLPLAAIGADTGAGWPTAALEMAEPTLRWMRLGWGLLVALYVVDLLGSLLRPWGKDRVQLRVGAPAPGCGALLLALGVPLLLGATTRIGTAMGPPLLWGVAFVALATLMPMERFVVLDRSARTVAKGRRYLLLRWTGRPMPFGDVDRVAIETSNQAHVVSLARVKGDRVEIARTHSPLEAVALARRVSQFLGVRLRERGDRRDRRERGESGAAVPPARAQATAELPARFEVPAERSEVATEQVSSQVPQVTVIGGDSDGRERMMAFAGCGCLILAGVLGALALLGVVDFPALWQTLQSLG